MSVKWIGFASSLHFFRFFVVVVLASFLSTNIILDFSFSFCCGCAETKLLSLLFLFQRAEKGKVGTSLGKKKCIFIYFGWLYGFAFPLIEEEEKRKTLGFLHHWHF